MNISVKKIPVQYVQTISWYEDSIVDWSDQGTLYSISKAPNKPVGRYRLSGGFDRALTSRNLQYALLLETYSTKGLILKNGEILREIDRSYYCAGSYDYPAEFIELPDGQTYLVHCPKAYNRIDIEEVETGKCITDVNRPEFDDVFHSRFEMSPDKKLLMSKGWLWHPRDTVRIFDLDKCIKDARLFDDGGISPKTGAEVSAAAFFSNSKVILGTSNEESFDEELDSVLAPGKIGIWDTVTDSILQASSQPRKFGNFYPIDEEHIWDLYLNPKIVNTVTGQVVAESQSVFSGLKNSSMRIDKRFNFQIAYDQIKKRIAILENNEIIVLSPS